MALTKIKADGLTADLIDETKLADNSIDSEHYNDGSIDEAHIADDAVTADKLANAINTSIAGKAVLTGSTDNTITTVTGANAIQGEANLTFDGSTLDCTGKIRVDISSTGTVGSGAAEGIFLRNTNETDNNAVTIFGGADDYGAAASAINFVNVDHSANAGAISFDTRTTGNSYAERLRIKADGHVSIVSGNLEFANGAGIDFSNVPDGSRSISTDGNKFDDYEEGTWTPNWRGATTAGTTTYAANGNVATYTKIGRQVNVGGYTNITAYTGSGILIIDNLPFASPVGDSHLRTGSVFCNNINLESDHVWLVTYAAGGSTMKLYATRDNLGWEPLYMDAGAFIWSLTYHAA